MRLVDVDEFRIGRHALDGRSLELGLRVAHHQVPTDVDTRIRAGPDLPVDDRSHRVARRQGVAEPKVTVDQRRRLLRRYAGGKGVANFFVADPEIFVARVERRAPAFELGFGRHRGLVAQADRDGIERVRNRPRIRAVSSSRSRTSSGGSCSPVGSVLGSTQSPSSNVMMKKGGTSGGAPSCSARTAGQGTSVLCRARCRRAASGRHGSSLERGRPAPP